MDTKCTCRKELLRGLDGDYLEIVLLDPHCPACRLEKAEEEVAGTWEEYLQNHT